VRSLVETLNYVNLALYTVVAIVAVREWRSGRGRAGLWAALTFGVLALVIDVAPALPEHDRSRLADFGIKLVIAGLVLFPYFLYRFVTAFEAPFRRLERFVGVMTAIVFVWTFALPHIPEDGESQPAWFTVYVIGFTVHWSVLTIVVAWRLWRSGRRQPSVSRRRMYMLGFASAAITAALIISATNPDDDSPARLVSTLVSSLSAFTFLLGLSPPPLLRAIWRRPETDRVQAAIAELMTATSQEEVAAKVLPPMSRLVGARAVALRNDTGDVIGTYDNDGGTNELEVDAPDVQRVAFPGGELCIWPSPYAPFFGDEELKLLRALGSMTGLALDRSRLFAQEVAARKALERADELKSNFIALAAHELRNPVATIVGLAQTLNRMRDRLPEERRIEVLEALDRQGGRLHLLVEQLLDLSRLDAEAVDVAPETVNVRERVEEIARAAAGERAGDVTVEIQPGLETFADPVVLERVVSNLVVNALRYGEPPVVVRAAVTDRHFRLTVEDGGPGVSPEFVPSLFERFSRSEGTRGRVQGTGLGLAIARSYARAHAGDLLYEPGDQGARFQLVLPAT
jgi:signal transduction histidine kinase